MTICTGSAHSIASVPPKLQNQGVIRCLNVLHSGILCGVVDWMCGWLSGGMRGENIKEGRGIGQHN